MILDAHVHLPVFENNGTLKAKGEQLLHEMDSNGVEGCIIISDSYNKSEIGTLDECVELFGDVNNIYIVGGISPFVDYKKQLIKLRKYLAERKVVGIKLFTGHEAFFLSDNKVNEVYELALEYDVPVLFHSGWDNSEYGSWIEAEKVLLNYPNLKLVCCHCFYPNLQFCKRLLIYPNMYFDMSSIADNDGMLSQIGDSVKQLIYGAPEKFIFGSDYGSCSQKKHIMFFEKLDIDSNVRDLVFWQNATKLYRLNK